MIKDGKQAQTLKKMMNGGNSGSLLKVLSITSGKGGVGKTNVVANLAYSLRKKNQRVLVFDADIGLGNVDILLGLAPKFNLQHVLQGQKKIEEIIVEGPGGLNILPATSGVQELTHLNKDARLVLVEELDRISDQYDYLIFDTGAGISSNVTYFCCAAHEILVIVSTEPTSLTDAYALIKVLNQKHGQKHFRLIVNTVKSDKEAKEIYKHLSAVTDRFLDSVSINYLGHIISDPNVPKSVRQQKPFIELYPYSKVSKCINDLSYTLIQEREKERHTADSSKTFFWNSVFPVQ
jgi:flagellar biosynthesis protein FlhG